MPIVNNYSDKICEFLIYLQNHEIYEDRKKEIDQICDDFNWLIKRIKTTIDSLAKSFYASKEIEHLNKVKKLLAFYFNVEQVRFPIDQRYLRFFNRIWLNKKSHLINNRIRFINWNYDFQVEMALAMLAEYSNNFHSTDLQRQCLPSTLPLYEDSIQPNYYNNFAVNQFSLCHLNGACYCHKYDDRIVRHVQATMAPLPFNLIFNPFEIKNKSINEILLAQIFNYSDLLNRKGHSTAIEFAWETPVNDRPPNNIKNKVFDKAIEATKETEFLVVIGYSFPADNLDFDKTIISKMIKLKKIYFQDMDPGKVQNKFIKIFPELERSQFVLAKAIDDFVIPSEYGQFC